MDSRPPTPRPRTSTAFLAVTASTSLIILTAILYFLYHLYYYLFHRSRTRPLDSPSPLNRLQRFSYREVKNATDSFSCSNCIGKGGSGTVYRGILRDGKLVAVKVLDSSSYQSEIEFQNEVKILGGLKSGCPFVVSLLGFCAEREKRVLVYEYMPNKSLQECLFCDDKNVVLNWGQRFGVILDVAKALAFLHTECDPPVIHGDVKPSNILLGPDFRAKVSDFGLSRLKLEGELGPGLLSQELSNAGGENEVVGAAMEGNEDDDDDDEVDFALALQASSSSKSSCRVYNNLMGLGVVSSPNRDLKGKEFFGNGGDVCEDELSSLEHSKELSPGCESGAKQWGKDWWWRQDGSGELCSKDYVMEWIGSQICTASGDWDEEKGAVEERIGTNGSKCDEVGRECGIQGRSDGLKEGRTCIGRRHRKMHEWWKEERMDESGKKGSKRRFKVPHFGLGKTFAFRAGRSKDREGGDQENEFSFRKGWRNKENSRSIGSDMWSGDLFSRELSSTTSMRGTLCYVAPEYGGFGCLMEKADVYSFGVLILVIVSGRRPLHVLSSPIKLERANLISWTRSLAHAGNVLELVDERLRGEYARAEATLCINLALACLQRLPELRPDIGDIVRVLKGEIEPSQLPFEFSPSPPSKIFGGSRSSRRKQKIGTVD